MSDNAQRTSYAPTAVRIVIMHRYQKSTILSSHMQRTSPMLRFQRHYISMLTVLAFMIIVSSTGYGQPSLQQLLDKAGRPYGFHTLLIHHSPSSCAKCGLIANVILEHVSGLGLPVFECLIEARMRGRDTVIVGRDRTPPRLVVRRWMLERERLSSGPTFWAVLSPEGIVLKSGDYILEPWAQDSIVTFLRSTIRPRAIQSESK